MKITLKPKPGSPSGCVCKEVTIAEGEKYSAGLLLKCTNCLKVHKTGDKNSCPFGTKIFAPSSRADWKAFIASDKPLRAPHWIVDVTRPQNGCGGCTRHPMHSGIAEQSTWRTTDGRAWWLRTSRYNEPNGDYNANCYLDLWQTPVNENSVTFNDWRCKYYSKSYYCQKATPKKTTTTTTAPPWKKVNTVPKAGSPSTCTCAKLTLKGEYSGGAILKCENCLEVKKNTQKNSCPEGTKLFSPQSRGDWQTFFDSGGTALNDPHWIIDVTRPKNGCGGCTGAKMSSLEPKQSTWKTKDGSPWWMRETKYNEPNGDYKANCYMALRNPTKADAITFNDGNCNYRSKSYYCQLIN